MSDPRERGDSDPSDREPVATGTDNSAPPEFVWYFNVDGIELGPAPSPPALLCCPNMAGPDALHALRAAGVGLSGAHATPEQLLADIQSVARGEDVLDVRPAPQRPSASDLLGGHAEAAAPPPLTAEHVRLLALIAEGHTDQEIAQGLHVSLRTAQTQIERLCQLARARNRTHLAAWAVQQGLVRLAPADLEPPSTEPGPI